MSLSGVGVALVIGMTLFGVSCSPSPDADGSQPADRDEVSGDQRDADDSTVVDLPYAPSRSDDGVRPEAAISGTLRADPEVDGGCVWLEVDQGHAVPLVWFDELRVRFPEEGPAQIEDRNGTIYAVEGEFLELGGGGSMEPAERCHMEQDRYFNAYFPASQDP